ncbi:pre-mRNA-splicing factor SYF1 [Trypanosoma theileri]|uniref:Pre-mRNA-splicing factor SYF1 n=1 Tax=Trypanosoma theileri TaxID=67003 RepID=A0A1X0NWW2_9TRYP|nr:pre-mRNA-splicing factor SYF1 [Trypanosoma theileri]ORC89101.1 pre-mRNA-splicing factor SYF1 [Trypanosoma theileri]
MGSLAVEALELEVLRNPTSVKCWLQLVRSIQVSEYSSRTAKANATNIAYERAIRANGFSYKLWMNYIAYRRDHTKEFTSIHEWFRSLRDIYDRAVEKLPMMPLLWISFIEFVMDASVPPRITLTRNIITRALKALPPTQHYRVWKLAKQWLRRPYVPTESAKQLWQLNLLFDTRAENQRDYFLMLWEKSNTSDFLMECALFLLDDRPHEDLMSDTTFWETIRMAFEKKDLCFTGDFALVEQLVDLAVTHCASPAEFRISYALFLTTQGEFVRARETFWSLLEDAGDAAIFLRVFNMAIVFEDQIMDSLAMDSSIQSLDGAAYKGVCEKLSGGGTDPLYNIRRLTQQHPLLLNQLQLRHNPSDIIMWLKRAELLQEAVCEKRCGHSDVSALFRQAITRCTSGIQVIDTEVAQLYESHACFLWENNCKGDAISVTREGAWHVNFSSQTGNVLLMGLFLEFMLMTSPGESLDDFLSRLQAVSTPNTIRSKGLAKSSVLPHLQKDMRAWILAIDLAFHHSKEQLERVTELYGNSTGYTAEGACYVAGRFWHSGNMNQAFREFERALVAFKEIPLAMLYVLQQYLSCLCVSFGKRLPLHHLRELTQLGFEVALKTIRPCPVATVEYLLNCVTLESQLGLAGTAVSAAQECLQLVLGSNAGDDSFLLGVLDAVLDVTFRLQGSQSVRQYCTRLLEGGRGVTPLFIQRVSLWWAAVEKRTGNMDRAHTILEACCKSQDPKSRHGLVFWKLWESICTTVEQFENVNKRKQQVSLKFLNDTAAGVPG